MIKFLEIVKRTAILLPSLLLAYLTGRIIYPLVDKRIGYDLIAAVVTYLIIAYFILPMLMRSFRLVFPYRQRASYAMTPEGNASDPINLAIVGSQQDLISAFQRIGWTVADPKRFSSVIRVILSTLFRRPYPSAPMSKLYFFNRPQDVGFVKASAGKRFERHHIRFWATTFSGGWPVNALSIDWHDTNSQVVKNSTDSQIWLGAASKDVGLSIIRYNGQLTHLAHPDTDEERDFIVAELTADGAERDTEFVRLSGPQRVINRGWLSYLHSDGQMAVVRLHSGLKLRT